MHPKEKAKVISMMVPKVPSSSPVSLKTHFEFTYAMKVFVALPSLQSH
jgi:hypothetical protein